MDRIFNCNLKVKKKKNMDRILYLIKMDRIYCQILVLVFVGKFLFVDSTIRIGGGGLGRGGIGGGGSIRPMGTRTNNP